MVADGGEGYIIVGIELGMLQEAADVNRTIGGPVGVELDGNDSWGERGKGEVEDERVRWRGKV